MPLSQVMTYNTEHLIDASTHWEALADQREEVFGAVHNEARTLPWEGLGADALHQRTGTDYGTALESAGNLRQAASIARDGASTLTQMHTRVLYTVEDIQADGFLPTEDLGVVDTRPSANATVAAQRQAQAQTYAGQLKAQVSDLVAHDTQVGADMSNAAAGEGKIQFVDHTFKTGPDQPGTGPYDPNPRYPGRNNLGHYGDGNTGSLDGAAAAEKALQNEEAETGKTLLRQQIRVTTIDPQTGQPIYRYYDALEPTGKPGEYVGIEVKSGTASLSPNQRVFDAQVSPQNPATGSLNGEPVKVIDTREIRAPQIVPEVPAAPEPAPGPAGRASVEPAPVPRAPPPLEGGFGGGPSEYPGPRLVDPRLHHHPHILGDWDPDLEEVP